MSNNMTPPVGPAPRIDFVQGRGLCVCPSCQSAWEQENETARRCCGAVPAIYDEVYREAMRVMEAGDGY